MIHPPGSKAIHRAGPLQGGRIKHTYHHRLNAIFEVWDRSTLSSKETHVSEHTCKTKRRTLLFVTHNTIESGNFGGVEVYQKTICDILRTDYEILFYQSALLKERQGQRHYELTDSRHLVIATFSVPDFDVWNTLSQAHAEQVFARILTDYSVDLVHFQHLINHCASLPLISRLLGVPSVYTLQDFWSVCTRYNLLDHRGRYCLVAERPKSICDICLKTTQAINPGAQAYRRSFFSRVLSALDRVIGNSASAVSICRKVYPELVESKFVSLGLPISWSSPQAERRDKNKGSEPLLEVVFLGNFTKIKGAETFLEMVGMMKDDPVHFTICGRIDSELRDSLSNDLLTNVHVAGEHQPGALDLTIFDVSLHLSIWPETFCITLSEAWKSGLIPIVSDCGALAERVTSGHDGFVIPIDGSGELVYLLRRICHNQNELAQIRHNIGSHLWLTPMQHCRTLAAIYDELIERYPQTATQFGSQVNTGCSTTVELTNLALSAPDWTRPDQLVLPHYSEKRSEPLSPLHSALEKVRAAFDLGLVDTAPKLIWHIDDFGTQIESTTQTEYRLVLDKFKPFPRLTGWVSHPAGIPHNLMLAIRSHSDLILRPVHLYDRQDLRSADPAVPMRIGFLTDTFPTEMLIDDIYSLELILCKSSNIIELTPLPAMIGTVGNMYYLWERQSRPIRRVIQGNWTPRASKNNDIFARCSVDSVHVTQYGEERKLSFPALSLKGWMVDNRKPLTHEAANSSTELHISGDHNNFYVGLSTEARPDIYKAFALIGRDECGFEGIVSISDIPPGMYKLCTVKGKGQQALRQEFGRLRVGLTPSACWVNLYEIDSVLGAHDLTSETIEGETIGHSLDYICVVNSIGSEIGHGLMLSLAGWILDDREAVNIGRVVLQVRGQLTVHCVLPPVFRRDVLLDRNHGGSDMSGFKGSMLIGALTEGAYIVELIKIIANQKTVIPLSCLLVERAGSKARVAPFKSLVPGLPFPEPRRFHGALRIVLDGFQLVNIALECGSFDLSIYIEGSTLEDHNQISAPIMLTFSGQRIFHVILDITLEKNESTTGKAPSSNKTRFSGCIPLSKLPAGSFDLTVVKGNYDQIKYLGRLKSGSDWQEIGLAIDEGVEVKMLAAPLPNGT